MLLLLAVAGRRKAICPEIADFSIALGYST
jgi:hypothetical protein